MRLSIGADLLSHTIRSASCRNLMRISVRGVLHDESPCAVGESLIEL